MKKENFKVNYYTIIENKNNDNVDIHITFSNNQSYIATFFTYENIKSLVKKNKKTGECLSGTYFWASDMILIQDLEIETIRTVVSQTIENNLFLEIFRPVGGSSIEKGNGVN